MAPSRKIPSYKGLRKKVKPLTPLQAAFRLQQEQDLIEMQKVPLTPLASTSTNVLHSPLQDPPINDDIDPMNGLDEHIQEPIGPMDVEGWEDVVEVYEHHELTDEQRRIVNELNTNLYQTKRLEQEARWTKAVESMVEPYIIGRASTSDWGDNMVWNHDFKAQCWCVGDTREVTLVDLLSTFHVYWHTSISLHSVDRLYS